jgi:GH24 family phage-related lysozyme (muramidase)
MFSFNINQGQKLRTGKKLIVLKQADNYQNVIDFLKLNEGFSPVYYDDYGYKAIGYGQRIKFYCDTIIEPISEIEAESILKKSFENHIKLVQKIYPKEQNDRLLSLAHISYTVGIGKLKQLYVNNLLDTTKLLRIGKKEIREFEIKLYNGK